MDTIKNHLDHVTIRGVGNINIGRDFIKNQVPTELQIDELLKELEIVQRQIGTASVELSDALDKVKKALEENKPTKAKSFLKELSDGATNILSALAGKTMRAFMDLD